MSAIDMKDLERRMDGAIEALKKEFSGLRTGRASTQLLENITVDAYGSQMPLNQVGTVSVPEARLLTVQVWDKGMIKAVEKSIREAGLGLNPMADGTLVRGPAPELSAERRDELAKVAGKFAESARVAIRNVRRDGMDTVKKAEKDNEMSEDEAKKAGDDIQKLTDGFIGKIDDALEHKSSEIRQV